MSTTFAKEASLVALAAGMGVASIGAYQYFSARAHREPTATQAVLAPTETQATALAKTRREGELEAMLAQTRRELEASRQAALAQARPAASAADGAAAASRPGRPDAAAAARAQLAQLRTRTAALVAADGERRWATEGLALWSSCVDLQKRRLPGPDAAALLDTCNDLLGVAFRFMRSNAQASDAGVTLATARALRVDRALLSDAQRREIDRLVAATRAAMPGSPSGGTSPR